MDTAQLLDIFLASVRDGFVQVSAFVALTLLVFSYVQYRTDGRLVARLEGESRAQPLVGALMGLTPGCGGAIVMMPLYVRGTVSFGTVVATLIATAGDSAFVILALAPTAGLYAYGLAFLSAVISGYAIDRFGVGVERVDRAMSQLHATMADGGFAVAGLGNQVHPYERGHESEPEPDAGSTRPETVPERTVSRTARRTSLVALGAWWITAAIALVTGVLYLVRGAPEVPLVLDASYAGAFTVFGIAGTSLSFYLYFVGRRHLGHGAVGRAKDTFGTATEALTHAAMETSFVTVWVLVAYLLYEYAVVLFAFDIAAVAAAAGLMAPVAGALLGLIPGCGPQIVLATAYSQSAIPFSALVANAISQDGDALFPLLAVDRTAAIIASIYTTVPALLVGVLIHAVAGPLFGFGVLS